MKKRIILLMMMAVMVLVLCACGNQNIDRTNTTDSTTEQMESEQKTLPETEETSGTELTNLLDEINTDIHPGTAGSYLTAVRAASHLLDWGVETDMGTEEIKKEVTEWLSDKGNDEQVDFSLKFASVYGAYQQLLGPDAEELLESAGCQDAAYPWSDSPVETIEAITEIVQLPEEEQTSVPDGETYPGADVVEIVNQRGDTTTIYKLADGRYMDRINRIFIFDGKDTWTDDNGVEWNEAVK